MRNVNLGNVLSGGLMASGHITSGLALSVLEVELAVILNRFLFTAIGFSPYLNALICLVSSNLTVMQVYQYQGLFSELVLFGQMNWLGITCSPTACAEA